MPPEPMTFDDVIAPLDRERFLSEFWGKSVLHQPGEKGRFTPLLPWNELNAILEWHCPPQPQVRLSLDGRPIDVRRYIDGAVGALKLNAGGLIASLSQGASLVLDKVQDVAPRVSQLAEKLQDVFQGPMSVNLYAGWRKQNGFDLHWDIADLFVLQLSGRKHWKVYAPTRDYPLTNDIETAPKPTGPPVFDGIISDGDMLHVPRGWWHIAFPLDEPSLHLTFGIESPHGADFVRWWIQKTLRHPQIRMNLPHESDVAAQRQYLATVSNLLLAGLEGDRVGDFLREQRATRRIPPRVRLPVAPMEQAQPLKMTTHIRLAISHCVFVDRENAGPLVQFHSGGHSWSARRELIPAFEMLKGHTSVSLQDMCSRIHDARLINTLMSALEQLAGAGVIFKEEGARL
jgi:Cupin superfamily protein